MLNLLNIVREFCRRQALPIPTTVVNSQSDSTLQMWGLMNEGQMDMADRWMWPGQIQQARGAGAAIGVQPPYFNHAGYGHNRLIAAVLAENTTEPGGGIYDGLGAFWPTPCPGFKSMVAETFWETAARIPVYGPVSPKEWMYLTTMSSQPSSFSWKLESDFLYIYPYSATAQFSFMYYTRFSVCTSDDPEHKNVLILTPSKDTYDLDSDSSVFPDRFVLQDLRWRWKNAKGLPYAEDQRQCEEMIKEFIGRAPMPTLHLDNEPGSAVVGPGLYVVAGSTIPL